MENKGISRNTKYRIQFLLFMCALPGTWSYQDISTKNSLVLLFEQFWTCLTSLKHSVSQYYGITFRGYEK